MIRMRTISQTVEYFKAQDPDTYVNEWWLRGLLKRGEIPFHRAGKRFLINLSMLEEYLVNGGIQPSVVEHVEKIRRIGG